MTSRKKKGTGFAITGALFIGVAIAFFTTEVTPEWISTAIGIIGMIAEGLGFKIVYPDND